MVDKLELLARLADNPEIRALVEKAKLVRYEVHEHGVTVWTVDNRHWEVRRDDKGNVYCTCPSWRFCKETPKSCKHTVAVTAVLGIDGVPYFKPPKEAKPKHNPVEVTLTLSGTLRELSQDEMMEEHGCGGPKVRMAHLYFDPPPGWEIDMSDPVGEEDDGRNYVLLQRFDGGKKK